MRRCGRGWRPIASVKVSVVMGKVVLGVRGRGASLRQVRWRNHLWWWSIFLTVLSSQLRDRQLSLLVLETGGSLEGRRRVAIQTPFSPTGTSIFLLIWGTSGRGQGLGHPSTCLDYQFLLFSAQNAHPNHFARAKSHFPSTARTTSHTAVGTHVPQPIGKLCLEAQLTRGIQSDTRFPLLLTPNSDCFLQYFHFVCFPSNSTFNTTRSIIIIINSFMIYYTMQNKTSQSINSFHFLPAYLHTCYDYDNIMYIQHCMQYALT